MIAPAPQTKLSPREKDPKVDYVERSAVVTIEFKGHFKAEITKEPMTLPRGCTGFTIEVFQDYEPYGYALQSQEVRVNVRVPFDLPRSLAIMTAVTEVEHLPQFYRGILDDAQDVEVRYTRERDLVRFYNR